MVDNFPLHFQFMVDGNYKQRSESMSRVAGLLQYAAQQEDVQGELSIWVCDDASIAELHRDYMGIDGPTDVMSFPGGDSELIPHGFGFGRGDSFLGDIAVSFETAAEQAPEAGHSTEREVAFLILHGFLHLAGYDDLDPESRESMLKRQEWLLTSFEEANPGDWG